MTEKLLKTSEVLTEVFKDEASEDEINEILRLNLIQEEISEKEAEQLIENVEDLLYLRTAFEPGNFEDLYFEVVRYNQFIKQAVNKINRYRYGSLEEGLTEISKIMVINVLAEKVGEPVNLLASRGKKYFRKREFKDSSEFMFGDLGTETEVSDLFSYSEIYSNILQYNVFQYFSHLNIITGEFGDRFRIYPSSVIDIRNFLLREDSIIEGLTMYDYIDILDSESALFTVEFWGGQIGNKRRDVIGFIYYSSKNVLNGENPILFSDSLEDLFDETNMDSIRRNNRIRNEDYENIRKIMEVRNWE